MDLKEIEEKVNFESSSKNFDTISKKSIPSGELQTAINMIDDQFVSGAQSVQASQILASNTG